MELAEAKRQGPAVHREDVDALVLDTRAHGLSYTDSMVNFGLAALAAPVFDFAGKICGGLTLIAPSGVLSRDELGTPALALRASAAALCARLTGKAA
jgi:DNA-binding IclR family transcriptional regulator